MIDAIESIAQQVKATNPGLHDIEVFRQVNFKSG
jgi:hypothetical protein